MTDEQYMREAIKQAKKALALGEVPIGCVIVKDDRIIARGYNRRNTDFNTLSHAELNAIRRASRVLKDWRLEGCTLYVTLEPCQMCAGAIVQARVSRVVMGAMNPKAGSAGSVIDLLHMKAFNHQVESESGVLGEECSALLGDFFQAMREEQRKKEPPKNFLKRLRVQLPGYAIMEGGEENLEAVLELMRGNPYFLETIFEEEPTAESVRADFEALPPGAERQQKTYAVLSKKGKCLAVLDFIENYPEEQLGFIGLFMVAADAHRKGIGRKLLKHLIKAAREIGMKKLRLACYAENEVGLAFWKSQGFSVICETERDKRALLVLEKELQIQKEVFSD